MAIDKELFLQSCNSIDEDCEFSRRNAASRIYYYLYHSCHELLGAENIIKLKEKGSHSCLISALQNYCVSDPELNKKYKRLSIKLSSSRALRVKADYHLDKDFSKGDYLTISSTVTSSQDLIKNLVQAA